VRDQSGGEVHFKVKPHTKFTKVFDAYCSKKAIGQDTIKFLFDGERIRSEQSPRELEMSDGDMIDAVIEQVGGSQSSR
jgi:small ubiquitin-related modifier